MHILPEAVIQFISDHEHDDEKLIVLQHKSIHGIPAGLVAQQIAARRKARYKLPTYYGTPGIVWPPPINLEQSSSEETARFKREVLESTMNLGDQAMFSRGADLSGGFGIDAFALSGLFGAFEFVEPEEDLIDLARASHQALSVRNITYHPSTAENFLKQTRNDFDAVFIDPSRRAGNRRVTLMSDASPNVIPLQEKLFARSQYLLVKAAPLLDIKAALKELLRVKSVFVVAVDNEVKELLFLGERNFTGEPSITATNLRADLPRETFSFYFSDEAAHMAEYADPGAFLYEPGAAIMKAGAFRSIGAKYKLAKIHPNTHLYTRGDVNPDFPGKIFKVEALTRAAQKDVQRLLPERRANVITRNFPLSVAELCRKTGVREGGERYMIAFSGLDKKFLAIASRVK